MIAMRRMVGSPARRTQVRLAARSASTGSLLPIASAASVPWMLVSIASRTASKRASLLAKWWYSAPRLTSACASTAWMLVTS